VARRRTRVPASSRSIDPPAAIIPLRPGGRFVFCGASEGGNDVCLAEVVSLEQHRLAGRLGERVGETVAEIQPCLVAALAEIVKGLAGDMRLFDGEGLDGDARPAEEHVALADGLGPDLSLYDDGEFEEVPGADDAALRIMIDCV